MLKWSRII